MRFVLHVKIRDADCTMKPSRANDLHAIRVDLNLDAADARIVSVGNCVVHGLGDYAMRYLVHVIRRRAVAMHSGSMIKMTADERYRLIRHLEQIALDKLHVDVWFALLRSRIARALYRGTRKRTLHVASEQQNARLRRRIPLRVVEMQRPQHVDN